MKATIKADGTLVVLPECELEAYALGRWAASNLGDCFKVTNVAHPKLMVNCEQWPQAMDPVTAPNFSHLMGRAGNR